MIWSVIVITSPPSTAQHGPGRQGPTSRPCRPIRMSDRRRTPTRRTFGPWGGCRRNASLNVMACVVKTVHGRVQGTVVEGGYAFLGIPYAAPPFGVNRLRPRQPVTVLEGGSRRHQDGAGAFAGGAPPTTTGPRGGATETGRTSRRPSPASTGSVLREPLNLMSGRPTGAAGLPVMVWIQAACR